MKIFINSSFITNSFSAFFISAVWRSIVIEQRANGMIKQEREKTNLAPTGSRLI